MAFAPKKEDSESPEKTSQAQADAAFGRWVVDKNVHDDALAVIGQLSAMGSSEDGWRQVLTAYAYTYGACCPGSRCFHPLPLRPRLRPPFPRVAGCAPNAFQPHAADPRSPAPPPSQCTSPTSTPTLR